MVYEQNIDQKIDSTYRVMIDSLDVIIEELGKKGFKDSNLYISEIKDKLQEERKSPKNLQTRNPYLEAALEAQNLRDNINNIYNNKANSTNEQLVHAWQQAIQESSKTINQFPLDDLSRMMQNCLISMKNACAELWDALPGTKEKTHRIPHKQSTGSLVRKINTSFQETKDTLQQQQKQDKENADKISKNYRPPSPGNTGEEF